jgi:predicted nucleic acid-binding protein
VELARKGIVEGLTCKEVLDELAGKLVGKLHFTDEQVTAALADFLSFLRLVAITGALQAVEADPDDDKVIECAVNGPATHVVSGDRRHLLPLGVYQGISIVSPAEFLKRHVNA